MIILKRATPAAIKYACLHFHYAKSVPSVRYGYNIYNDGCWCGCILFSNGAIYNIGSPFGLGQGEVLELVRVALNGKQTCTSQCVALALKKLHHDAPQVKLVVSYADCDQNHKGIIYQATNWVYLGIFGAGTTSSVYINGEKLHRRSCYAKYHTSSLKQLREKVDVNATMFVSKGKHKYIYCFDKALKKEWQKKSLPYPK